MRDKAVTMLTALGVAGAADDPLLDMVLTTVQWRMDGGLLAKFDADAEYLDEDMDFTFEDFEMPETFSLLAGMQ